MSCKPTGIKWVFTYFVQIKLYWLKSPCCHIPSKLSHYRINGNKGRHRHWILNPIPILLGLFVQRRNTLREIYKNQMMTFIKKVMFDLFWLFSYFSLYIVCLWHVCDIVHRVMLFSSSQNHLQSSVLASVCVLFSWHTHRPCDSSYRCVIRYVLPRLLV